jgi:hypothetical protein
MVISEQSEREFVASRFGVGTATLPEQAGTREQIVPFYLMPASNKSNIAESTTLIEDPLVKYLKDRADQLGRHY